MKVSCLVGAVLVSLLSVHPSNAATISMDLTIAGSFNTLIGSPTSCSNGCLTYWSPPYSVNPGDTLDLGTITFGTFTIVDPRVPVISAVLADFAVGSSPSQLPIIGLPGTTLGSCFPLTDSNCPADLPTSTATKSLVFPGGSNIVVFWDGPYTYISPVPLPGAFPLFVTGLGALGALGWHRKRRNLTAVTVPD